MRMLTLVLHMNQTQHGRVDFHNLTCYKREKSSEPAEICPIKNFVPNQRFDLLCVIGKIREKQRRTRGT